MKQLTAIIIAKNAEKSIQHALASVAFADEVLVIDTGSVDQTIAIAKKMEAIVFEHKTTDFSEMRNYGLSLAQGIWILYVDTDEIVTAPLQKEIQRLVSSEASSISVYKVQRKNYYYGSFLFPQIEYLERLFKKTALSGWYGRLHESPKIKKDEKVGILDGFLLHYSRTDLSLMVTKTNTWSEEEALLRFNANHPKMTWWRFPRVMFTAFFNSYILQGGWKIGTAGLVESIYQSFSMFITYAKLWEFQHDAKK